MYKMPYNYLIKRWNTYNFIKQGGNLYEKVHVTTVGRHYDAQPRSVRKRRRKERRRLNVGVFYYTYSDTYISSVRTALDNALTEAGIKFQNYDGNSNQTTQNEQIDTAIAQVPTFWSLTSLHPVP